MAYWKRKCLFYNCHEKYVKGYRYHEQKIFHMDVNLTPLVEDLGQEEPSKEKDTNQPS